jgi:hypothetical protein
LWRDKSGGRGPFTQSSVCPDLIGCSGPATVGSIEIDTVSLDIAHCLNKPILGVPKQSNLA